VFANVAYVAVCGVECNEVRDKANSLDYALAVDAVVLCGAVPTLSAVKVYIFVFVIAIYVFVVPLFLGENSVDLYGVFLFVVALLYSILLFV